MKIRKLLKNQGEFVKSACWKEMWQPILLKNRKYLKLRKNNKIIK